MANLVQFEIALLQMYWGLGGIILTFMMMGLALTRDVTFIIRALLSHDFRRLLLVLRTEVGRVRIAEVGLRVLERRLCHQVVLPQAPIALKVFIQIEGHLVLDLSRLLLFNFIYGKRSATST